MIPHGYAKDNKEAAEKAILQEAIWIWKAVLTWQNFQSG
jgi:hypothetical protein